MFAVDEIQEITSLAIIKIDGPVSGVSGDAERILRTLPDWFGIESSLLEYVRDSDRWPTFVAREGAHIMAFITLREHSPQSWEVHCLAVEFKWRNRGIGKELHRHIEEWLLEQGVRFLQVKTMAALRPSSEYAETRAFYEAIGYTPLEVFPTLWGPNLPALQLVKYLPGN